MPPFRRLALVATLCTWLLASTNLTAQVSEQAAVEVTATVTTAPPSITFVWPLDATATGYTVSRRAPEATTWGTPTTIPGGGGATTWSDLNVTVGMRYEYLFRKTGNPNATGMLTAGIEASALEDRGMLVLLVDASKVTALGARLDRLVSDLTGDGWYVLRHDVQPTASVPSVKALITADVTNHPGHVRSVFLLGRVPVPYSGWIAPDGHPDHAGAWPADLYYGELDGPWTDVSVNVVTASRVENVNTPNDGKFDQSNLPSDVDLAVGRVDLANMPSFALSETALLQQYLDKDHDYRHKLLVAEARAIIDDNFGYFGGEAFAASGWRNFSALLGTANVSAADYFTALNTTSGTGYQWAYGCGGGWYQGAGGVGNTSNFVTSTNRCVFTMLFGSYFGDWDSTDNFLRAPLCTGWTLADMWAGRPHWLVHPMGMGETLGMCAKLTQNDTTIGGYGARFVHVALMGDPTLREHVIAPSGTVAVADAWPQAMVSWLPSSDVVAGYHVYSAPSPRGPFKRVSTALVTGTSFVDPSPDAGDTTYMVRAVRLETTPSGSYWNLSQGSFANVHLPVQSAAHVSYGTGCYAVSDSIYQYFATAAAASAALQGHGITLTPANGGYTVTGNASFVAPSAAATVLQLGDDAETAVALSQPFAYPGGSTSTLHVHSNGIVAVAPLAMSPLASAAPSIAAMLNEASTAWYCWHDFAPNEPGTGPIVVEEVGGTLYVTWNGVESHPFGANPSTLQLQFEFATGVVRYVWPSITAIGTGSAGAPSEQFLLGWSPGGASTDAGATDLATSLPFTTSTYNQEPLRLSASPAPVVTPSAGCVVTYGLDHVPAWSPGLHVACTLVSFTQDRVGTSLAAVGMPGCMQHLGSFDLCLLVLGTNPSLTTTLSLPPGIPGGTSLYAQAVALFAPNSLPNGQNTLGAVTSNGIHSFLNDH